ncbi:MAG: host-nuclease inhibitor Gam family protein [Spirochaetota bacterium]
MSEHKSIQALSDWEQVDSSIREIGELQIAIDGINGDLTERTNSLKARAKAEIAPHEARQKYLTALIEGYCHENKAAFAEKRSKELTFGSIGFRIVHKMSWPRAAKKLQDLVVGLKNFGLSDCIRHDEVADKSKVEELDGSTLAKLGLKKETIDSFRIEPNFERIRAS